MALLSDVRLVSVHGPRFPLSVTGGTGVSSTAPCESVTLLSSLCFFVPTIGQMRYGIQGATPPQIGVPLRQPDTAEGSS